MRQRRERSESGQVLILVVMVMVVLVVLAEALLNLSGRARAGAYTEQQIGQAFYAADAGIEYTRAKIVEEPDWFAELPDFTTSGKPIAVFESAEFAGGSYQVQAIEKTTVVEPVTGRKTGVVFKVSSTGVYREAKKSLQATFNVCTPDSYLNGFVILPDDPTPTVFTGNFTLMGDLLCNGDIYLYGSAEVDGNLISSRHIDIRVPENFTGLRVENYQNVPPFPELDEGWYRVRAGEKEVRDGDRHIFTGDHVFSASSYNGLYFVDGDVLIMGDLSYMGTGVIFATGNIEIGGSVTASDPEIDKLTLITPGEVSFRTDTSGFDGAIVCGTFRPQGNVTIYGPVCTREFIFDGNDGTADSLTVICPPDYKPDPGALCPSVEVIDWREKYDVF